MIIQEIRATTTPANLAVSGDEHMEFNYPNVVAVHVFRQHCAMKFLFTELIWFMDLS